MNRRSRCTALSALLFILLCATAAQALDDHFLVGGGVHVDQARGVPVGPVAGIGFETPLGLRAGLGLVITGARFVADNASTQAALHLLGRYELKPGRWSALVGAGVAHEWREWGHEGFYFHPSVGLMVHTERANLLLQYAPLVDLSRGIDGNLTLALQFGLQAWAARVAGSGRDPVPRPRPFKALVGAAAGYSFPVGDYHDSDDNGLSLAADVRLPLGDGWFLKPAFRTQKLRDWESAGFVSQGDVRLHQLLLNVGRWSGVLGGGERVAYWELGAGYGAYKVSTTYSGIENNRTNGRALLGGECGLLIPMHASGLMVDLNGSAVTTLATGDDASNGGVILSVRAGLAFPLGRAE